jgi:hypothetical protein
MHASAACFLEGRTVLKNDTYLYKHTENIVSQHPHYWFQHPQQQQTDKADELIGGLRTTLEDDHKILDALVNFIDRKYSDAMLNREHDPKHYWSPIDWEFTIKLFEKSFRITHSVWTKAYSSGPSHRLEKHKDRETLRHSHRLVKQATRLVKHLIELSKDSTELRYQTAKHKVELADRLCEAFVAYMAPQPNSKPYQHPSLSAGLNLKAQCHRRMHEVQLAYAKQLESIARNRSTLFKLPAALLATDWACVKDLGFIEASVSEDGKWREQYLPYAWSLTQEDATNSAQILDQHGRVRANVNFGTETTPGSVAFKHREELVRTEKDGKVTYRRIDNRTGKPIGTDETAPLSEEHNLIAQMVRYGYYTRHNQDVDWRD